MKCTITLSSNAMAHYSVINDSDRHMNNDKIKYCCFQYLLSDVLAI